MDEIIIDGVIYSADKRVLIKYPKDMSEERFYVPDFVEELGDGCFSEASCLKHIIIGKNVKKIGNRALGDAMAFTVSQIYIPRTATELTGEIFDCDVDDGGNYYPIKIVGGEHGSAIERYCNQREIPFIVFDPDKVETFYELSAEELRDLAIREAEEEREWIVEDIEHGYNAHFCDGTLIFSEAENAQKEIVIKETKLLLNTFRRRMVKKVVIGDKITEIADWAFDGFENLEQVHIGAGVCRINTLAFCGHQNMDSRGCESISAFTVDENNRRYKSVDGVLFTYDMKALVRYAPAKSDLYYRVDDRVCNIGAFAFMDVRNLQCLYLGDGCVSIGELAFLNAFSLRHVYFASRSVQWPERFPFIEMTGYDRPYRLGIVYGGPSDSSVQQKCTDEGEHFHVIEKDDITNFLAVPVPSKKEDRYLQDCLKIMIVSKNGVLEQAGEFGDELILPEGVVSTMYRINLSKCKRVVIPSTMKHFWAEGLDGPAPDLKEFSVSPKNEEYSENKGHLLYGANLISYAPGAENYGVIPEGTEGISEGAFRLISKPIDRLRIPSSLRSIQPQYLRDGWFYEAEVDRESTSFKAIDGSIYSIDGKRLVYAKISQDGYVIPDGTEVIGEGSLYDVQGEVTIPASVHKIEYANGFNQRIKSVITPKGSFAAWYLANVRYGFPVKIVYDGEVEPWEPKEDEGKGEEWNPLPCEFVF